MLTLFLHCIPVTVDTDAEYTRQNRLRHIQNQVCVLNKRHAMYTFNHYTC